MLPLSMFDQSYDTHFLRRYPDLSPTPLQLEEDLEQLKVLENGYKMKVFHLGNLYILDWKIYTYLISH